MDIWWRGHDNTNAAFYQDLQCFLLASPAAVRHKIMSLQNLERCMSPRRYDDDSGGSYSWAMGLDRPKMTDRPIYESFSERFTVSITRVEETSP